MANLFDQLKLEGPVQKSASSPAKSLPSVETNFTSSLEVFNEQYKTTSTSERRESLPFPITVSNVLKKPKSHKARSLSPPKHGAYNVIKSLKVKLERKKLEEFLARPLEEHANNIRKKQEKIKDNKLTKVTPTKAQQKLFEPLLDQKNSKAQMLKQFNVKPCKVRVRRDNLQEFLKGFKSKNPVKKDDKTKNNKISSSLTFKESPPSKKSKLSAVDKGLNKTKNSFFIKLNTSPTSKVEKRIKNSSKCSPYTEAHHNKIKNSKFNTTTAPTKFSRTQLLRSFGKRFFNVQVKIERCTHPLMLTFESNDRARRLQAKRNKSKNLSVSFQEQVEIFGGSSDSDDSFSEDFCAIPTNRNSRKSNSNATQPITAPVTPVVMPARLKKVENGKVVDDIELDPSLFVDPKILVSSTPFSPGRKKRDHKSFSPLKDESSTSPRKEQLKLANEKIPPSGLRRVNIDEDEDEDDECEYIVPIEMPQRRTSRTSSNTTLDDLTSATIPLADSPVNFSEIFDDYATNDKINCATNANDVEMNNYIKDNTETNLNTINIENGSDDSFQSAKDNIESNEINAEANQYSSLRSSPTSCLHLNPGTKKSDRIKQLQTNGNVCDEISNKRFDTLNAMDDISMNLFLEDSETNEDDTHGKSFVDTIINETINKLSKDIDEHATSEHYTDTT